MMRITSTTTLKYIATILLFLSILLGLRWTWSEIFSATEHSHAVDGILDLRGRDLSNTPTIPLDGEWKFYPEKFVSHRDAALEENQSQNIQVPGDWGRVLARGTGSSFGYGTYRLRILVDPLEVPVAFWLRGLQSASTVEINGQVENDFGKTADNAKAHIPKNFSYTASYAALDVDEIELLIRISNFEDPYNGGILRSIRFGSQAAIDYVRWYSIGFQLVMLITLLIHGVYACILYLFSPRERALFFAGLLTLAVGISIVAGHDNLLLLWLPINYTWALKIKLLALVWQPFFILHIFTRFSSSPPRNEWLRLYTMALISYSAFLLVANAPFINGSVEFNVFSAFYVIPFAWFVYVIGKMVFKKQADIDVVFLLLSAAGIMSNFLWSLWNSYREVTVVYYPLDIIAAIIGFSAYWFKKYFRHTKENNKLNEQLKNADKQKDQFLANTSHELRTPLHGIINIAQSVAAKEKETMDPGSLKDMELLITISRRMSHMLGDLLDVARLQEHRIVLQKEPVIMQAIVPGVFGMLRFMIDGKPIKLQIDIPESMLPVMADEKRLVQIIYNLVHNALKFTEKGSITVSAEARDGHAVIHVSDTGIGMSEDMLARIFLPYEQGASGISDGRGIGLGLSICKQLIELHGGTLTVRSAESKGSVFSFDLPLANSSSLPQALKQINAEDTADNIKHLHAGLVFQDDGSRELAAAKLYDPLLQDRKINILAVDDDPVNLNVLVGILSTDSYAITTAHSARAALELLATGRWDLLIADVMMPNMSGYELTQRVREHYSVSELPILLLTARSQPADIYTGFLAGANDYVTKPVDALELQYRIRALTTLKLSINERLRMEAAYLQAQIHPHFLFNTLNSIMALSEIDSDKMRKMGDAFASFLRISFDFLNMEELVELAHELELVEAYLFIERERFEDRLSIIWEVEPGISLLLPPLSIQPLVENAVRHGLLSRFEGGTVHIRIARSENVTLIEVKDNGIGMAEEKIIQLLSPLMRGKSGIGLANTHRRLTQLNGQGLTIASKPNEGTTVSFAIPNK
ncbi:hybrid sensor histidine kinase/response regulator [Paenibacillus sp. FJAT-27812]|uniref:hybrid sensor histidine kinase/response regulator n=1 Tax=Paenibacillus sp. FJAT-27812 TaxID=1684143 RepID=UPI0006A76AC6|nr:ATP-binding protein [Paenibacillus sp. FJAT-27812]